MKWEEVNLRKLHTVWFQLYVILEKAKLWRLLKDQQLPVGGGGMNRRNTDDLQGSENTLSDIMYIMVDLLVQTHRICNPKSEPYIKYGPWVIVMYQHRSTEGGVCSHEIKRRLLLRQKAMTNLDSVFKSRDITLPTKVCLVKYMVFPVVVYGCESWTIKKAECWRIDAFELWCWRRLESPLLGLQGNPTSQS